MNSHCRSNFKTNRQTGFSLLEVLITIVVLAIGLLGLAAMQARGLNNNISAYQRSQAAVLTYDMADKMRSNIGAISNYLSSNKLPAQANEKAVCKTTGVCTTDLLAEDDLFDWNAAIVSALPGGTGTIVTDGTGLYTITVAWNEANRDDNRDGVVDADNSSFQLSFRP